MSADANPWDERYGSAEYYYGTEPNDFLRERAPLIPVGGEVLCLGEGEGRNAVFLAGLGYRVTALDQSPVGLDKAQRLAAEKAVRIDTVVTDLAHYRIEAGRWAGIVSIWCHLPSALRPGVHRQIVAGLKPGGVLLLESYTPQQLAHGTGGPRSEDLLPTLAELRGDLHGLEFLHAEERERVVAEGRGHHGPSAVVQIVARKLRRASRCSESGADLPPSLVHNSGSSRS
ncbi:MAG TPA: class I SAM-dependent methyltransferase [Steroidobacteraceae bacterium]|nr:class I SAM-dependent methyltransferase [Steroidobacteraceae bacterium]